jgi:tetratricopeptide (TPR) repeat protein
MTMNERSGIMMAMVIIGMVFLVALSTGCKRKGLDELIEEGKYSEADSYCESVKEEQRAKCYNILATLYFRKDKFDKAAQFYARAGEHIKVIHSYFRGDFIEEAEAYTRAQDGLVKRNCAGLLAKKLYIYGDPQKAIEYYHMAGQHRMANYIEEKTPVFELYTTIKKLLPTFTDPAQRRKIADFNITLKSYIYMDSVLRWPYGRETEVMKQADELCLKALRMIDREAAPVFIEKLRTSVDNKNWNERQIEAISFAHAKMGSLGKMIKYIHNLAALRKFFTRYSVVYHGEPGNNDIPLKESKGGRSSKSLNYEQALSKALIRGEGLFETIDFADKNPGQITLAEYIEDFNIDLQVIDYILTFMQNLETRIKDIQQRSKQYGDTKGSQQERKKADRLFWQFVAEGNKVLQAISLEQYQKANDSLTSAYEAAKTKLKIR